MFVVQYKDLRNVNFRQALGKIYNHGGFKDVKVLRDVSRLVKALDGLNKEADELLEKMAADYSELDENGKLKTDERGFFKLLDDKKDAWELKSKEFLETSVEVNADKLKLADLSACGLTPHEFSVIECLLNQLEVVN